jgi:hypothetical protein
MSVAVDRHSVELLLRVMETPEVRAQGSALRLVGSKATDTLLAAGLLVGRGHIPVVAAMDDYEDEPIAAEWSPEHQAFGYRDSTGRWIKVDEAEITAYGVDFPRAVAGMLVQFDRAGSPPPQALVEGHLLDLGVIRLAGAEKPVPVWLGRCLGNLDVWQKVAGFMERRPPVETRIILTSTRGERIPPSPNRRDVIVAVSDVIAGPCSLAISPEILSARVFPGQVQRREPIDHSEHFGIVWLRGKSIPFGGDKQREALRQLFTAYWNGAPRLRTAVVLEEAGFSAKVNSFPKAFGESGDWRLFIKYAAGNCWIEP